MRKIGIGNFQLPAGNGIPINSGRLLPPHELARLKAVTTPKVLGITLRALDRAERYECRHPLWNSLADCYLRVNRRMEELEGDFPGIVRVIHNSEVMKGDLLVSDFHIGLNYGFMNGGTDPVRIKVLEVEGDLLKGEVLRESSCGCSEVGFFRNELWLFLSHRLTLHTSRNSSGRQ